VIYRKTTLCAFLNWVWVSDRSCSPAIFSQITNGYGDPDMMNKVVPNDMGRRIHLQALKAATGIVHIKNVRASLTTQKTAFGLLRLSGEERGGEIQARSSRQLIILFYVNPLTAAPK
jgi:hypothetical protein